MLGIGLRLLAVARFQWCSEPLPRALAFLPIEHQLFSLQIRTDARRLTGRGMGDVHGAACEARPLALSEGNTAPRVA